MKPVVVTTRRPVCRPWAALRRAVVTLAVPSLALLAGVRCFGDLVHPSAPRVEYAFTAPLGDTILNVGDTTDVLPCRTTANGHEIGCQLALEVTTSGGSVFARGGRVVASALGTATVEMRPLNVQFALDTIVRRARIRTVVPRVIWADPNLVDTLGPGVMKLIIALPVTRSGAMIAGAPMSWVQDSGFAAAHLIGYLPGWIQADAAGVAVFHAVSDTASSAMRRVVVVPPHYAPADGASGGHAAPGTDRP